MAEMIYTTALTLDGFLADEHDSLDWLFAVPGGDDPGEGHSRFLERIGVQVMGSSTYEWVVRELDALEHPERWHETNGRPTWVFTTRDLPAVPGAQIHFASGPVAAHLDAIEAAAGGRGVFLVGGGDLVGQFADLGRLDEIRATIAPATLGAGKPFLPRRIGSDRLRLVSAEKRGPFAELVYAVSAPAG